MPFIKNAAIFAKKQPETIVTASCGPLVGAATNTSYAIKPTGSVWSWGDVSNGRTGNSNFTSAPYRTPISVGGATKTFRKIFSNYGGVFGIDKNGQLWAWGWNYYGTLGISGVGQFSVVYTPTKVDPTKTFLQLAGQVNSQHVVALDKNGKAWAWGWGQYFQLGNNDSNTQTTPIAVGGATKTFCKVGVGSYHSCAIDKSGKIWCWGGNFNGQVGQDWATQYICTPTAVLSQTGKTFCEIQCGDNYSVAIDKNGGVWGWGVGYSGQLGNNNPSQFSAPVAVAGQLKTFCKIAASNTFTLGIDKNGKGWGWGSANNGEMGTNTSYVATPVSIYGTKTFCDIGAGNYHSIAIDKNNKFWTWGLDDYGQLGINGDYNRKTPISLQATNKTFCAVHTGRGWTSFVRDKTNTTYRWGVGPIFFNRERSPVSFYNTAGIAQCEIAAGLYHFLALDQNGKAWGWGYSQYGSVGHGNYYSVGPQYSVVGQLGRTFCKITAGDIHSVALDKDGRIWTWGGNYACQLGQGITADFNSRCSPALLWNNDGKTFCKIAAGKNYTLAIDKNGKVWSWGENYNGYLGDNSNTQRCSPVSICETNTKTFCKIAAGENSSLAIDKNGKIWSWGGNSYGQLGINSTSSVNTPVSVLGAAKTFCQISIGTYNVAAIDKNGKVWCWGINTYGQLGDNSVTNKCTPVSIAGSAKTFCHIQCLNQAAYGIDKNGKLWVWGYWEQVGSNPVVTTPVQVCNI